MKTIKLCANYSSDFATVYFSLLYVYQTCVSLITSGFHYRTHFNLSPEGDLDISFSSSTSKYDFLVRILILNIVMNKTKTNVARLLIQPRKQVFQNKLESLLHILKVVWNDNLSVYVVSIFIMLVRQSTGYQ